MASESALDAVAGSCAMTDVPARSCSANARGQVEGPTWRRNATLRQFQRPGRVRSGDPCAGIADRSLLSALSGLPFGEPSLSRRVSCDVGIRSVGASPQAL